MITRLLLTLALFSVVYGQPKPTETYDRRAILRSGSFILHWKFTTSDITFEVHARTTGWVGLGISENANMIGSDITMGWIKDGVTQIQDMRGGTSNGLPTKDSKQDIHLLYGKECDGWTVIKFLRQLGACESSDREITSSTTRVIWAYGASDPSGDEVISADKHDANARGSVSLYLLDSTITRDLPPGRKYETYNMTMSNYAIPAVKTYYNCILFKLDLTEKRHVVKIGPIITPQNKDNVHHMIIYSCGRSVPDESEVGRNHLCYGSNMAYTRSCVELVAAWAVGGSEFVYSDVAGLPIGGDDEAIYFQLEIHYDNPHQLSNLVDNSGLMLTYTADLLDYDLGVFQIGSRTSGRYNFIPPRASDFLIVGMCGGTCINDAMSEASVSSLNMTAIFLHSHTAGRKLKLRHIRNGIELEPVNDDFYDFNYQEIRLMDPVRTILPGDKFRMECRYNTETRTNMTLSGLGTEDEMCLAFLIYYPRIDMSRCLSREDDVETYEYFGIKGTTRGNSIYLREVTAPSNLAGKTVGQVMDEFEWNQSKAEELSKVMQGTKYTQACLKREHITTATLAVLNLPVIEKEYKISQKNCTEPSSPYKQTKNMADCSSGTNVKRHFFFTILLLFIAFH